MVVCGTGGFAAEQTGHMDSVLASRRGKVLKKRLGAESWLRAGGEYAVVRPVSLRYAEHDSQD